jgi:hypothetical protein
MIDAVDRVLVTKDTGPRLRTPGCAVNARKAVELTSKQVHVKPWAPRAHPADSTHDRAGVSVAD